MAHALTAFLHGARLPAVLRHVRCTPGAAAPLSSAAQHASQTLSLPAFNPSACAALRHSFLDNLPSHQRWLSTAAAPLSKAPGSPLPRISLNSPDFLVMRKNGEAYVDKSGAILDFLADPRLSRRAFFVRPRRFGKSLALGVMEAMLAAGKLPRGVTPWPGYEKVNPSVVFKGLEAHKRWAAKDPAARAVLDTAHFVVSLTLAGETSGTRLGRHIIVQLASIGKSAFGAELERAIESETSVATALKKLLGAVPKPVPIAILVDEYDNVIVGDVSEQRWEAAKEGIALVRSLLLATKDPTLNSRLSYFVVTGVARFARASLFSGANNFYDATADPITSRMLGFTAAELRATFPAQLERLGRALAASGGVPTAQGDDTLQQQQLQQQHRDLAMETLEEWYNGYCFDGVTSCFAPAPVLASLDTGCLTGTEMEGVQSLSWLALTPLDVLRSFGSDYTASMSASSECFDVAALASKSFNPTALLQQLGLLTLTPTPTPATLAEGAAGQKMVMTLRPPNRYARNAALHLVGLLLHRSVAVVAADAERVQAALASDDHAAFEAAVRELLMSVPYAATKMKPAPDDGEPGAQPLLREAPFHTCLYGFLRAALPGKLCTLAVEEQTAFGSADIVIKRRSRSTGDVDMVWVLEVGIVPALRSEKEEAAAECLTKKVSQGTNYYVPYKSLPGRVAAIVIDRGGKSIHFGWRQWKADVQAWVEGSVMGV